MTKKKKKILTTGDVAKVSNVSLRTAQKWFDTGLITGYLLPGSKNRRVSAKEFKQFLEENNMPMDLFNEKCDL